MLTAEILEKTFKDVFFNAYKTTLCGGFDEPFYLASDSDGIAQIQYRYDYASSALHEISHWCVAGEARRQLDDFGYWYAEDGRSEAQQKQFEQVEITPQSYECIFHWAAGMPFDVSVDNLALPDYDPTPFRRAVYDNVKTLLENGLPKRVEQFAQALYLRTAQSSLPLQQFLRESHENNCR